MHISLQPLDVRRGWHGFWHFFHCNCGWQLVFMGGAGWCGFCPDFINGMPVPNCASGGAEPMPWVWWDPFFLVWSAAVHRAFVGFRTGVDVDVIWAVLLIFPLLVSARQLVWWYSRCCGLVPADCVVVPVAVEDLTCIGMFWWCCVFGVSVWEVPWW